MCNFFLFLCNFRDKKEQTGGILTFGIGTPEKSWIRHSLGVLNQSESVECHKLSSILCGNTTCIYTYLLEAGISTFLRLASPDSERDFRNMF